ncbi:ATP-binding protein [Tumebacillus sp. DT12]|uniref:histidine kinase n=1 Tax=Tumebacillus lacus TaxID=2995335 RepID=A0ABT3X5R9_9BACL|nr:ATP-binding protein [Tumebacillus lacus]MCX7572248.1 ATP-binding protein [Tumebacillus lacus]
MNQKFRYAMKYIVPALLILLTTYTLVQIAVSSLQEENEHKLRTLNTQLTERIKNSPSLLNALSSGDRDAAEQLVQPILDEVTLAYLDGWDSLGGSVYFPETGIVVAISPRDDAPLDLTRPTPMTQGAQTAYETGMPLYYKSSPDIRSTPVYVYSLPLQIGERQVLISITQSIHSLSQQIRSIWLTGGIVCLLSLLVITVLAMNEWRRNQRLDGELNRLMSWLHKYDAGEQDLTTDPNEFTLLKELPDAFAKTINMVQYTRRRKREVLNQLPFGIITLDANRMVRYMNPYFQKLSGFDPEEMQGWTHQEWHAHYRLMDGGTISDLFAFNRSMENVLGTLINKKGQEIPISITIRPLSGEDGESLGYLCMIHDLSDELELDRLTQKTHYIFNSIPLCMILVNRDRQIKYVNPAVCRLFGKSEHDLIEKTLDQTWGYELIGDGPSLWQHIERAMATGIRSHLPAAKCLLDEREYDFEFDLFPMLNPYTGEADGCMLLIKDNTVYREWEELSQRVDAHSHYVQMAATIAHEVRNPMTSVRGFLQLLAGQITGETQQMYLEVMQTEIDRMNSILSEYLSMARAPQMKWERISLSDLVSETFMLLEGEANYRGIHLELINTPGCEVHGLSRELKQVLINLVRNAFDAIDNSSDGRVRISLRAEAHEYRIDVADNGCGITQEQLAKIFDPFFTTKAMGTGLGLPVCKKIVESHGGSLTCESTAGEGTTFTVRLPEPCEGGEEES